MTQAVYQRFLAELARAPEGAPLADALRSLYQAGELDRIERLIETYGRLTPT